LRAHGFFSSSSRIIICVQFSFIGGRQAERLGAIATIARIFTVERRGFPELGRLGRQGRRKNEGQRTTGFDTNCTNYREFSVINGKAHDLRLRRIRGLCNFSNNEPRVKSDGLFAFQPGWI
jgi:hypothetical protein